MHFTFSPGKVPGMTEEELYAHLSSTLVEDEGPWSHDPICEGDWKPFTKGESTRILARLSAEQVARAENPIPFHARVRRLRGTILPLYPGCVLIEGEANLMEGSSLATFICILGQKGLLVFTWNASDILRLNQKVDLKLDTEEGYRSYLLFYSAIATGNEGRFRIYESLSGMPWERDADELQRALAAGDLQKMKLDISEDGVCTAKVSAVYGHSLYKATFSIREDGRVEVAGREEVMGELRIRTETFFGPFKLYR